MHFKQIPLALAIGAALVTSPAIAQKKGGGGEGGSSVTLYGKLYPYALYEDGSGATAAGVSTSTLGATPTGVDAINRARGLQAGNSRIGFRGREDLGDGLSAVFQLEGTVAVDTGIGGQFNRDTFVGLEGKYGLLRLGNMDTVFKNYGDTLGLLGISSGTFMSTSDLLRKTGFGNSSASSFHLRRPNSIVYETPEVADFQAGLQVSTNEGSPAGRAPKVYSFGIKYDSGPFYVAIAHEIHRDLFGGSFNAPASQRNSADFNVRSRDNATQLTLEYRLNKVHKFEFDIIRKNYVESAFTTNRFHDYKNTAYLFSTESTWGPVRTGAYYVHSQAGSCTRVNAVCTTDGLDGSKVTAGAAYYFSRRTFAFAAVSRIYNGKAARYSSTELGSTPNPGEDITQAAFGLSHTF
ncbi:MAG: porin [Pseudomonadota bacterium]|nr:porin [Pseudomonadota bacterium]